MTSLTLRSIKHESTTFRPESAFRNIWAIFLFVGIAYNAFSVPWAWHSFLMIGGQEYLFSVIVDVFFIVDIFMNLYVFQVLDSDTGLVRSDPKYLTWNYVTNGSFYVDLISAIPLDFCADSNVSRGKHLTFISFE